MTTTLLFEGHSIETYAGHQRTEDFRGKSIVSVTGPSGSGKSSFLQTLLYPLGTDPRFRRAVRENVSTVATTVNLGGASYRLLRSIGRSSSLIKVYEGNSGERLLTLDIKGRQGPPPSQWIFEQMGIDKLFADARLGRNGGPASIEDLLAVFSINQDDIDRQIMRHRTHDSARKTMLELLIGLADTDVEAAKNRLSDLQARRNDLKRKVGAIEDFHDRTEIDADVLREELREATEQARLAAQRLKELKARRAQACKGGRGGRRNWAHCPACRSDLRDRDVPEGDCRLCLSEHGDRSGSASAESWDSSEAEPTSEELAEAEAENARLDERVKGLKRALKPHQALANLRDQLNRLEAECTEAAAAFAQAKIAASANRERLHELNARFLDVVRELRPPWFERNARIDFETYLPIVEGDDFDGLGGGVRGTITIAYHVTLLSYALITGATYLPNILIADSPRRNLGSNAVDKALARRVYEHFQTFRDLRAGLPTRSFQLIVADNDLPNIATTDVHRIKFDHERPFVPGVEYTFDDADPLDGRLEV